jgi:hypothetical protein
MSDTIIGKLQKAKLVPNEAESRRLFKRYGTHIGYLAITWNRLHDNLSKIFVQVLKSPSPKIASAVWFSTNSDFSQREMLRVAVPRASHLSTQQRESILWLLCQVEETLRYQRNDAIHAPLVLVKQLAKDAVATIQADMNSESPRVRNLLALIYLTKVGQWAILWACQKQPRFRTLSFRTRTRPAKP